MYAPPALPTPPPTPQNRPRLTKRLRLLITAGTGTGPTEAIEQTEAGGGIEVNVVAAVRGTEATEIAATETEEIVVTGTEVIEAIGATGTANGPAHLVDIDHLGLPGATLKIGQTGTVSARRIGSLATWTSTGSMSVRELGVIETARGRPDTMMQGGIQLGQGNVVQHPQ